LLAPAVDVLASTTEKERDTVSWGLTVGVPQTLGLTVEASQRKPVRFQASIGSVFWYSSITTRLILISQNHRLLPYGFVGAGVYHKRSSDTSPGDETNGFGWVGGGLRFRAAPVSFFAELGLMAESSTSGLTAAAGFLFSR